MVSDLSILIYHKNNFCWEYFMFYIFILFMHYTGCPKKHGNSVTNSISSFQIILWFSIVIPTEKAVICKSFDCYFHILFVYYDCTRLYAVYKQIKLVRLHCSSCKDVIDTSLQSFHKINSSRHNILKLGITMLIHNKDDIQFVTEFPCFWQMHEICFIAFTVV